MGKKHDSQYANFGWLQYNGKSIKFIELKYNIKTITIMIQSIKLQRFIV